MVTFGLAAWKSSATFWNAPRPGWVLALCHHVNVTGLPPLSWPPAADDAAELAVVAGALVADVLVAGVLAAEVAGDPVLLELEHAVTASAATAATAVKRDTVRNGLVRLVMSVPSAWVPHPTREPGGEYARHRSYRKLPRTSR